MTIRHHLSDSLLMAYCAGRLPEAFDLVLATHVSLCDDCRARMVAFDTLGGTLLDDLAVVDRQDDSAEAAMARITALPQMARETQAVCNRPAKRGIFPAPLIGYVGGDLAAVRWRPVGLGVRQAILPTEGSATVRLLNIPAGQAVPDHGHRGVELTLVLQGAFHDKTDRFAAGDLEIATEAMEHRPVAEPGVDCICLAATDAPLRFNRLIPRLAQPFFRI